MENTLSSMNNSGPSCFILRKSGYNEQVDDDRYKVSDIVDLINRWSRRYNRSVILSEDYIVSDSKDPDEVASLFSEWGSVDATLPEFCPLRRKEILLLLGRDQGIPCNVCQFVASCRCRDTLVDLCMDTDVFIIGRESFPRDLKSYIVGNLDDLYSCFNMRRD